MSVSFDNKPELAAAHPQSNLLHSLALVRLNVLMMSSLVKTDPDEKNNQHKDKNDIDR